MTTEILQFNTPTIESIKKLLSSFDSWQTDGLHIKSTMQDSDIFELFDRYTSSHLRRTKRYVQILAYAIEQDGNIGKNETALLEKGAVLHDLGKLYIPTALLHKKERLTSEEFFEIKKHALLGAITINSIQSFKNEFSLEMASSHHERWDGGGYPYGQKGGKIPFSARIMAVADVYDALTNIRAYKNPMPHNDAVNYIISQRGSHFDPYIVEKFTAARDEFEKAQTTFD